MRQPSHTEMIREGTAITEFNSNQLIVFRLDTLQRVSMQLRTQLNYESLCMWLEVVKEMDSYLEGLLEENKTRQEITDLAKYRISFIPPPSVQHTDRYFRQVHERIDNYYRRVKYYLQLKGLGVTAKTGDDPTKVMLR